MAREIIFLRGGGGGVPKSHFLVSFPLFLISFQVFFFGVLKR